MYNNQLHELKFPLTSIWRDAVYPLVRLLFLVNIYIFFFSFIVVCFCLMLSCHLMMEKHSMCGIVPEL